MKQQKAERNKSLLREKQQRQELLNQKLQEDEAKKAERLAVLQQQRIEREANFKMAI